MTDMPNPMPAEAIIIGDDGLPIAHIDFDQLDIDATLLSYDMAHAAAQPDPDHATRQIAIDYAARHNPDYLGYISARALGLTARNILAPTLDVAASLGVDLRAGLARARTDAQRDLGQPTHTHDEHTPQDGGTS